MVPAVVMANTFCTSRDTRFPTRVVLIFLCGLKLCGEKLSTWSSCPKRKFEVTMHFSEMGKLLFEKERHILLIALYFKAFLEIFVINYL